MHRPIFMSPAQMGAFLARFDPGGRHKWVSPAQQTPGGRDWGFSGMRGCARGRITSTCKKADQGGSTLMEIVVKKTNEIFPYPNNPRKNNSAVSSVMESIRQCGYIAPIIIDENGVILAGHTRYKAIKKLG